jgi:hypothetical protein
MKNERITNFSDWFEGNNKEIISSLSNTLNCYPNPKLNYQPERLSPEDHFLDSEKMACDSLNTTNK